jgi:hypothetical protein
MDDVLPDEEEDNAVDAVDDEEERTVVEEEEHKLSISSTLISGNKARWGKYRLELELSVTEADDDETDDL